MGKETGMDVMSEAETSQFMTQGFVVLSQYLNEEDLSRIEVRVETQAPNQDLRDQYNQSTDSKRYEYSLTRNKPIEVLGKRKVVELESAFADSDVSGVFEIGALTKIAQKLCPLLKPAECFCIVSECGSEDQPEHTDSIPNEDIQTPEEWQQTFAYVGLLTPMRDTNVTYGQTALIPRSHIDPTAMEEVKLSLRRGDVLVMDGRTVHRGLANTCADPGVPPRRICFFTYTLPGVVDGNAAAYADDFVSSTDGA
jgi:ectoine hydroxylase-related dioxygenase (phytanoyl-CoA dioxygenase family)